MGAYGVVLPLSRQQEQEADRVGVMLAAKAGYDPTESVRVWERLGQITGEWSTSYSDSHPGASERIADLIVWSGRMYLQYPPEHFEEARLLPEIVPPDRPNPFGL
jgi:predicted Zn-dependent protease